MTHEETQSAIPPGDQAMPATEPPPTPSSRRRRGIPTWLVGVVMLLVGVAIGFFGRPLVLPPPATGAAALVQAVLAQTRHFKGNANAPVTMIEFSDFQ